MNLDFGEYEPWMKEQVVSMFCEQYGNEKTQFTEYFDRFYGTFQENKALRIAVLDGKTVAGFVSFSYWPYRLNGKTYNSFQCGNVIINKNYRGQGLYNKMLDHIEANASRYNIDFIIGFPIKEILKLYLKSRWSNPFNLSWYVSVVNPIGKLFKISESRMNSIFSSEKKYANGFPDDKHIILNSDRAFYTWNERYNNLSRHYYLVFEEDGKAVEFSLKINSRKYLNELIVGEVNANSSDPLFLVRAFKYLKKKARATLGTSIVSICLNDHIKDNAIYEAIRHSRFRKIDKDIKFIVKNFRMEDVVLNNPQNWLLFRRDIDTW